ncbi:MAG TPA: hypothetical protein VK116_02100, partial [Planctomycetota bacterium]|nr:hypothetical protein [Planctomycetota bacterium]
MGSIEVAAGANALLDDAEMIASLEPIPVERVDRMATPKMLALRWLFLGLAFAAAPLSFVGCDNDRNERVISSREFIAPTLESMRLMASKLSIIRAIRPDVLDNEV